MSSPVHFIDNRQYHKSNYNDAVNYLIPSMYLEEDYALKDNQIDILDQIINSHLKIIGNISSVINVSAIPGTIYSSINTANGISKFFIKQNDLTNINLNDFEKRILLPLDTSFKNFNSSSEFSDYLKNTLLPGIQLNKPTLDFLDGGSASANHNYLITNLSWIYFLNFSATAYSPSSYVHDILINNTYQSKSIYLNDGIRGLTEYVWRNYTNLSATWQPKGFLPYDLRPPAFTKSDAYTSGTQQLDKLLTLVDVIYSPLYIDNGDTRVLDAINDYLENSYLITQKKLQGPFLKLVKAFSFSFADYSNEIDKLETLNDLDNCPDEYLPLLADLIGWKLFGSDPDRWRLQLANAVDIYRVVGTKKSIQFVIDSIFGEEVFKVSSTISECWESYVPFLIYYALGTESSYLKSFKTWNQDVAQSLGVSGYSSSSMDENLRLCVDKIIYDIVFEFSSNFLLGNKPFDIDNIDFLFNYRGREFKVPPFEEIPYYTHVIINRDMINAIEDKLVCFGVPVSFAAQLGNYIKSRTLDVDDDYSVRNSWLMFTSGCMYPPNWDSIMLDTTNNKLEYLPLWNGKSSHYKVLLDVSNFNFIKDSLEADSKEALAILAQTIQNFSPAKSIPEIYARANMEDSHDTSMIISQSINLDKIDYPQIKYSKMAGIAGYQLSALAMSTYKRGLTATSVPSFSRTSVDSLIDSLISPSGTTALLPRRNHRRRNFKFTLPKQGFYDRTGFNMPISYQTYLGDPARSFFPLGLIPSSQCYVSIPDYNNIPPIYSRCENLNSSSIYSGLAVSNTFPVRGWKST